MSAARKSPMQDFKDQTVKTFEDAKLKTVEGSKEAAQRLDQEAHRRPWLFVAIAAGIAGFFAFFLGRKSKRSR